MKLIEDDGEVIQDIPDEAAMLVILPDRELGLILPARGEDEDVTEVEILAAAVGEFLRVPDNVRSVMLDYGPRFRDKNYKGN